MKRFFLLAALAAFAANILADPIDENQAMQIAAQFADKTPVLVKKATRNEERARKLPAAVRSTAPYYIFSRGVGQGYVIVSGDDCLPQVLAIVETGDFDEKTAPPHQLGWLNYYAKIIEQAQVAGENKPRKLEAEGARKAAATKVTIPALLTTHWHQSSPYNDRCPYIKNTTNHAATGCVATAAAQVIYYFHKDNPDYLGHTTPTYSYGDAPVTESIKKGTPIKWDLMRNSYSSEPAEFKEAVAEFVFAVGAATWLTYGSSTAGQINDLVNTFSSGYNLSSTCVYKGGTSTTTWENMIYDDLVQGYPMVYCGYNQSQGGHAVCVDGYNATTKLFHFNFGWGGQGDGWYTVDDQTGMNGFNSEQGMTYKVRPKKRNIQASISLPQGFYAAHDNVVRVKVNNNSTLEYSGLYAFITTGNTKPSSIKSANASETTTVIPNDGTDCYVDLTLKPALARNYYVKITDADLNVLVDTTLSCSSINNDLTFNKIYVAGSNQTETHNNQNYTIVYGSKANVIANVHNNESYGYQGSPRFEVFKSDDDGKTFELVGYKTANNMTVDPLADGDFVASLISTSTCPIEEGKLYGVALKNPLASQSDTYVRYENNDTLAYFIMKQTESPMAAQLEGATLVFSGDWNEAEFATLAAKREFAQAKDYDISAVNYVGDVSRVMANPNAFIYVPDNYNGDTENVVVKSTMNAKAIVLENGNDFAQNNNVHAQMATLTLNLKPAAWQFITVPFNTDVPDGLVAKEITAHLSSGITNKTQLVNKMEAGKTYLVMPTKTQVVIKANDVDVLANSLENADPAVVGVLANTTAPAGAFIINDDEQQYFQPSKEAFDVEAFGGYFYADDVTKQFRASSNIVLDASYLTLAQAIYNAYQNIDQYESIVTEEANQTIWEKIQLAEAYFTNRTSEDAVEVKNYAKEINEYVEDYKSHINVGDTDGPIDMTSMIVNPSFELGNTAATSGSTKGWTADGSGVTARDATNIQYFGVGTDGKYIVYAYNTVSKQGAGIHQTITDLMPGYYRMTAKTATEPGYAVTIYANEKEVENPASEFGQYYLSMATIDSIKVEQGQELTIGTKAGRGYKLDDFRLYYIGSDETTAIENVYAQQMGCFQLIPKEGGLHIITTKKNVFTVYSLAGQKVKDICVENRAFVNLQKGIYVINGKKVFVK